ncbi:MAG: DNA methyltransferase [Mariprofundaceae bacterium]|nr:DNA methyltransferase [Mariprofundaceae bacterium]
MTKAIFDNSDVTASSKQLEVLKKHFPQCFDKHGAFMPEKLQDLVSASGSELSKESYALNWLGKSYARLLANEKPRTLLSEDKEHNAKPENKVSENLLIKGDNLEVLKHLVNAYSEQVKMIYIDPPYNTGSDGFVYQDDRKFTPQQLSQLAGIDRDEAKRILSFTQSKANSHSAWLTFMYPRLYIARELLKDDGVIFISIDDNEVAQLKMLCDEVFGEENFISTISSVMKSGGAKGSFFTPNIEFILVYARSKVASTPFRSKITSKQIETYYNKVQKGGMRDGEKYGEERLYKASLDVRPNQRYWIECPDGSFVIPPGNSSPNHIKDGAAIKPDPNAGGWKWVYKTYASEFKKGNIIFKKTKTSALINQNGEQAKFNIYNKLWLSEQQEKGKVPSNFISDIENRQSSQELKDLSIPFDYAKPSALIKYICEIARLASNDIVLDFFAGSGTTAHAVMELNAEDSGNRRCISVQIDEATDKKSEAYKAGYKTIFEITKKRIENAAVKIKEEKPDYKGDLGFKIFETKSLSDAYLDDIPTLSGEQQALPLMSDNVDDILTTWQVYDGIELTKSLETMNLAGYDAYHHDKVCYLMHKGFSSDALVAFLQKLDDTDNLFEVEKLVVNGVNFDSKYQREIAESISQYKNKKDKHISVEFRY